MSTVSTVIPQNVDTLISNHFRYCTHSTTYGCTDLLLILEVCRSRELKSLVSSFLPQNHVVHLSYSSFLNKITTDIDSILCKIDYPTVIYVKRHEVSLYRTQYPGLRYSIDFPNWISYSPILVTSDIVLARGQRYVIDTTGNLDCMVSAPLNCCSLYGYLSFIRSVDGNLRSFVYQTLAALDISSDNYIGRRISFKSYGLHATMSQCVVSAPLLLYSVSTLFSDDVISRETMSVDATTDLPCSVSRGTTVRKRRRARARYDRYKRF